MLKLIMVTPSQLFNFAMKPRFGDINQKLYVRILIKMDFHYSFYL